MNYKNENMKYCHAEVWLKFFNKIEKIDSLKMINLQLNLTTKYFQPKGRITCCMVYGTKNNLPCGTYTFY